MNEEKTLKETENLNEEPTAVTVAEGETPCNEQDEKSECGAENGDNKPDGRGNGAKAFFGAVWRWLKAVVPGVALCAIIAVPSWFSGMLVPVIGSAVFAIVIGMVIAFFRRPKWLEKGIKFTSKKVLQASIVFLGFGMNFISVVQVGGNSLLIIVSTIATSLVPAFILGKLLHIPSAAATLVGVGSSICGGSAIAATAPAGGETADDGKAFKFSFVKVFPWFVIFFLVAAVISTWLFPAMGPGEGVSDFLSSAGKFMITLAMAAIGLNTNIIKLIRTGVKPILLGFICWVAIAFVSIGVQSAMGMLF